MLLVWCAAVLVGCSGAGLQNGEEISFQDFVNQFLSKNKVSKIVVINNTIATVFTKENVRNGHQRAFSDSFTWSVMFGVWCGVVGGGLQPEHSTHFFHIGSVDSFERKLHAAQEALDLDQRDFVPVVYATRVNILVELLKSLPTLLLIGFTIYIFKNMMGEIGGMAGTGKRGGKNIFSFGKSPATVIKPGEKTKVTFKDVAGLDEAKVEIMEFVKFLKNPVRACLFVRLRVNECCECCECCEAYDVLYCGVLCACIRLNSRNSVLRFQRVLCWLDRRVRVKRC